MKYPVNLNRVTKFFGIIALVSSITSLIISYLNPATAYEISIYVSTPLLVWFFIILSTFISISLLIISIAYKSKSNCWIIGLFVLLFNRLMIQWIPFIRGYLALSGDHISHIGFIMDILKTGFISDNNFYPLTHIILSETASILNVQVLLVGNLGTALISIFSVLSIYVVAKYIFKTRDAQIVVFASAAVIFFSGYDLFLMPNGWSIFLLPIILFVFLKSQSINKINWSILLLIFLWALPFYHPLTAIMMIVILTTIGFITYFLNALNGGKINIINIKKFMPYNQILIIGTLFLVWVLSFRLFSANVVSLYEAITSGSTNVFLNSLDSGTSKLNFSTFDLIVFMFKYLGHDLIYLSISLLAFIYYFKKKYYNNDLHKQILVIFAITATFLILYVGYLGNFIPGLHAIGGGRIIAYSMMLTPIIIGWAFNQFSDIKQYKKYTVASFILIIILASSLSLFSLIPSPYIEEPNVHVAQSDLATASWAFNYSDDSDGLSSILSPVSRYSYLLYGATGGKIVAPTNNRIPDHFGYNENESLGTTLNGTEVILINPIDKIVYSTVWASVGRFDAEDFNKLYSDQSTNKIYSNNYGEIWIVR